MRFHSCGNAWNSVYNNEPKLINPFISRVCECSEPDLPEWFYVLPPFLTQDHVSSGLDVLYSQKGALLLLLSLNDHAQPIILWDR